MLETKCGLFQKTAAVWDGGSSATHRKLQFLPSFELVNSVSISYTAWKVSVFGVILVRIFPHSDWIWRDTRYLSVFSPNTGKCGPNNSEYGHFLRSVNLPKNCYIMSIGSPTQYIHPAWKTILLIWLNMKGRELQKAPISELLWTEKNLELQSKLIFQNHNF